MVPAGNKAKCLLSVNHTTKTIHHHHHHRQYVPPFQNHTTCFLFVFRGLFMFCVHVWCSVVFPFLLPWMLVFFFFFHLFHFFCTLLHDTLDWMPSQKTFDRHDNQFVFHSCIHMCFPSVLEDNLFSNLSSFQGR